MTSSSHRRFSSLSDIWWKPRPVVDALDLLVELGRPDLVDILPVLDPFCFPLETSPEPLKRLSMDAPRQKLTVRSRTGRMSAAEATMMATPGWMVPMMETFVDEYDMSLKSIANTK